MTASRSAMSFRAKKTPPACRTSIRRSSCRPVPQSGFTAWKADITRPNTRRRTFPRFRRENGPGPPLTFKLPGAAGYASITEANLVNYSGLGLEADGRRGWITGLGHRQPLNHPFELRYGRDEGKRLGKLASITGTITTPWRVVIVGRDLNTLVNSTILPNLCPLPDPTLFPEGLKTAWVKPGRAVWRYVDGGPSGLDGMKQFSRMAGQLGFEHHVIEGFWSRWSMEERKEIVDFSKQQGVGLWFWKHGNQLRTPEAREEFFKMLQDLGVVGAKIDFFDHEAKELVDLYEAMLRKAAEHHILLVFHGANKPTGRERTWPNEMVREAIRGMEASRLKERARHETILPFTRYLAGPADYTTMIFSARAAVIRVGRTRSLPWLFFQSAPDHCRQSAEHPGQSGGRCDQRASRPCGTDHRSARLRRLANWRPTRGARATPGLSPSYAARKPGRSRCHCRSWGKANTRRPWSGTTWKTMPPSEWKTRTCNGTIRSRSRCGRRRFRGAPLEEMKRTQQFPAGPAAHPIGAVGAGAMALRSSGAKLRCHTVATFPFRQKPTSAGSYTMNTLATEAEVDSKGWLNIHALSAARHPPRQAGRGGGLVPGGSTVPDAPSTSCRHPLRQRWNWPPTSMRRWRTSGLTLQNLGLFQPPFDSLTSFAILR